MHSMNGPIKPPVRSLTLPPLPLSYKPRKISKGNNDSDFDFKYALYTHPISLSGPRFYPDDSLD